MVRAVIGRANLDASNAKSWELKRWENDPAESTPRCQILTKMTGYDTTPLSEVALSVLSKTGLVET